MINTRVETFQYTFFSVRGKSFQYIFKKKKN